MKSLGCATKVQLFGHGNEVASFAHFEHWVASQKTEIGIRTFTIRVLSRSLDA